MMAVERPRPGHTPRPRPSFVPAGREFVSLAEIAGWTGLHIATLRRHVEKGALRTVVLGGGKRLVRIDALLEYLGDR
jgi:hypothetical protein